MDNTVNYNAKTFIQEQRTLEDGTIVYGEKYFFDINTDTSKNSSSEVADSPIDARLGATLQDKRVVNMKTVGISGKFNNLCTNNSTFRVPENRLGIIISYFEKALEKQQIYRVCKKGTIYSNMMLNKLNLKFGEYATTVDISLSFIEVNIISIDVEDNASVITDPESYQDVEQNVNSTRFLAPKLNCKIITDPDSGKKLVYAIVQNLNGPILNEFARNWDDENSEIYTQEIGNSISIKTTLKFKLLLEDGQQTELTWDNIKSSTIWSRETRVINLTETEGLFSIYSALNPAIPEAFTYESLIIEAWCNAWRDYPKLVWKDNKWQKDYSISEAYDQSATTIVSFSPDEIVSGN